MFIAYQFYIKQWPSLINNVYPSENPPDPCIGQERPKDHQIRIHNKHWQVQGQGRTEIFLYSAFYDDRLSSNGSIFIRIIAIADIDPSQEYRCMVWSNNSGSYSTNMTLIQIGGRNYTLGNKLYCQLMLSCPLEMTSSIPTHVSVMNSDCRHRLTTYLPVLRPTNTAPGDVTPQVTNFRHRFGVCVPIAYGSIPTEAFVEWIEFNRMFGVTEFTIYDAQLSPSMAPVFDYYKRLDVLRIYKMPPAIDFRSYRSVKINSPGSLTDCMMRNMYDYEYVVTLDFDEIIVPRLHDNYTATLERVDQDYKLTQPFHTYTFRNAYFFEEFGPDVTQSHLLRTARYRRRAPISIFGFAPKSFVNPRRCLALFNHYCLLRFPASGRDSWIFLDVSSKVATSHHYRRCTFGSKTCSGYFKEVTVDDTALRFVDTLRPRVEGVLRDLRML